MIFLVITMRRPAAAMATLLGAGAEALPARACSASVTGFEVVDVAVDDGVACGSGSMA